MSEDIRPAPFDLGLIQLAVMAGRPEMLDKYLKMTEDGKSLSPEAQHQILVLLKDAMVRILEEQNERYLD